jgi:transcriptional regulator with XRE-family HTH domain
MPLAHHRPSPGLGDRIRRAREAAGLTRTQLAAAVDLSAQSVAAYEYEWRVPTVGTLCAIAAEVGVPVGGLLAEDVPAA